MRMDHTQRAWLFISLVILVLSAIVYVAYVHASPAGPRGGSTTGLLFGILGFAFMIFAAALGARKRVPTWRLGRAQAWMRGHLWLGFLSLPLILFHGGFHFGGTLTRVIMWLLIITVASGIFGAALQNYLPRLMTADVALETIYDEIGNVRRALREEAGAIVASLCGNLNSDVVPGAPSTDLTREQRAGGFTALRPVAASAAPLRTSASVSAGASAAVAPAVETILLTEEESAPLKRFYFQELRPYLANPQKRGQRLSSTEKSRMAFAALKTFLPAHAHSTLRDLEDICDEARQLVLQERLHLWLHGWLLVHIPLSLALMVLSAVHAVMALRY
ncbi:MAG TPA: hypothetical protein VMJ35_04980 [Dongiaceae bacterium]|nr:hypothetical protein [Dongiaceae bacterium]